MVSQVGSNLNKIYFNFQLQHGANFMSARNLVITVSRLKNARGEQAQEQPAIKLGRPEACAPASSPMDWPQFIDKIVGNKGRRLFERLRRTGGGQGESHRQKDCLEKPPASALSKQCIFCD